MPGQRRLPRSAPRAQGVSARGISAFLDSVRPTAPDGPELHSLMVVRHGAVVAEGWWHPHRPDLVHELYSLSKSFTSTAVGFARAEGLLSVDDLVLDHVGDLAPTDPDPKLTRMRIRHLLTMTTGHTTPTDDRVFPTRDWAKAFLALPIEEEPGTAFLYNTAATYLLSFLVQRLTGHRVLDYLGPRLLDPLGIEGATWEQSPEGVDTGGFGMSLTSEDIACFGQLYLDDGLWQGRRVLPDGWVAEATRRHNESHIESVDWAQGYGYQFWRCQPPGVYRGDGAFAQFCIVMPEQDAVVVTTSGTPDLQGVLDRVWEHLLPAMAAADDDDAAQAELAERLDGLELPVPTSGATRFPAPDLAGRPIAFEPNALGLEAVTVTEAGHDGLPTAVTWRVANRTETLRVGDGSWALGTTGYRGRDGTLQGRPTGAEFPVAAAAAWTGQHTLTLQVRLYDTPYCLTVDVGCDGDQVRGSARLNVGFGPTELGEIRGVIGPR